MTDDLIDLLLGELPPERAAALRADPALRPRIRRYEEAIGLIRDAALGGWEAAPVRRRWRTRLLPIAALLLAGLALFFLDGRPRHESRVFEPDLAFGELRPEETDAAGRVRTPSTADGPTVRLGSVEIAALGATRRFPVAVGGPIPPGSEITTSAEGGARIDLPHRAILFLGPLSTVHLRARADGATALRVVGGVACTIAEGGPLHVAVDDSDLLLVHRSGAALFRHSPAEAVNLRGALLLDLGLGRTFAIPPCERLPAACVADPETVAVTDDELGLDWYTALAHPGDQVDDIAWQTRLASVPLAPTPETLLYLRFAPNGGGTVALSFGGEPRTYALDKRDSLELRLRLRDLGDGPVLTLSHRPREARLFTPRPRAAR